MAWGWVSRCWANLFPFANAEMNMPRQFILSICGTFTGYRCGGRLLKTNIYTSGTVDLEICTWICRITARGARCKNSCLLGVGWCWMNAYIYIHTPVDTWNILTQSSPDGSTLVLVGLTTPQNLHAKGGGLWTGWCPSLFCGSIWGWVSMIYHRRDEYPAASAAASAILM